MKHDEIIYARIPSSLRAELERERKRMSKTKGVEVNTSAAIRAILERDFRSRRRTTASARA
jgi:hypothetical protein